MKILFLGEIAAGQTSSMRMRALQRLGHDVAGVNTTEPWQRATWIRRQLQRRVQFGSVVEEINESVTRAARHFHPKLIWAEKQEFLRSETIADLRKNGARLVHFTPDPYFSLAWKRTRLMDEAISCFDVLVYCKAYERDDYAALGKASVYMPLGYCDETHRPLRSEDPQWHCEVGFLGGWEPRRERFLHAIAASGAQLKVWGGYWDFLSDGRLTFRRLVILRQLAGNEHFRFHRDHLLTHAHQGGEIYGDDYTRALSGARIGIGFLRQVCPDQHTTRSFEIPACGSMLIADRTAEHQAFFEEAREAEFFGCLEELLEKITFYRSNETARRRIADAGRDRCETGRYAYVHRLQAALTEIART